MTKKTRLERLLNVLSPDPVSPDFAEFDKQVEQLKQGIKEKIQVKTLDDVNSRLKEFKKRIDLTPLIETMTSIENGYNEKMDKLAEAYDIELSDFRKEVAKGSEISKAEVAAISDNIALITEQMRLMEDRKAKDLQELSARIESLYPFQDKATELFSEMASAIDILKNQNVASKEDTQKVLNDCMDSLESLRKDIMNRINNMPRGGGNQNRNIAVGGNTSVLSTFTDINIKAGNNVTITYANNQTTKYLDLTIAATGGGSSTAGVVRSINTINTSQTAAAVAGTDYVYLCTEGIALTLPVATGNTNLYTIKNVSNSSVLVAGTIDDDVNGIIMPVKYTTVDLISNDTDWKIT